jgi:diguanylate cyclase
MSFDLLQNVHLPRWNRRLLTGFWGIVGLSVLLTAIFDAVVWLQGSSSDIVPIISVNTLRICASLLLVEALHAFLKPWQDYIVLFGAALLAVNLIISFPLTSPLLTTLYLPIMVSVFYFQRRKVVFGLLISLLSFIYLYAEQMTQYSIYQLNELLAMLGALIVGGAVALGIVSRGAELLKFLRTALASEQELRIQNILMDKLSKTDALTELYNHMSFHEYLDELILHGEKHHLDFTLAVLDIDRFKKVNDTYGHRAGDAVLKRVASVLRDMVSPNDFAARYGGEEFAVLFTDTSPESAVEQAEHIRKSIALMKHPELDYQPVTISIGIHSYEQGCRKEELFIGADEALYEAKRNGRNQTVVYTASDQHKKRPSPTK